MKWMIYSEATKSLIKVAFNILFQSIGFLTQNSTCCKGIKGIVDCKKKKKVIFCVKI